SAHLFIADAHQSLRWQVALPDVDAGADQRAHHAVAERVGLHLGDQHTVWLPGPAELLQGADGGRTLPGLAECCPVVQPEEGGRGRVHQVDVERGRVPDGVASLDRVPGREV